MIPFISGQDWKSNKVTTAERTALAFDLGAFNKYLQVYDTDLDKRFAWDGLAWVEIEIITSSGPGPGVATALLIDYIAQVNIAAYDVVTSEGKVGNSATIGQRSKIIGIADVSTLSGFAGTAVGEGNISNPGWSWTIGDVIYLNGTTLSTTAPSSGYSQKIGTATASDTIDVDLASSILL